MLKFGFHKTSYGADGSPEEGEVLAQRFRWAEIEGDHGAYGDGTVVEDDGTVVLSGTAAEVRKEIFRMMGEGWHPLPSVK